MNRSRWERWAPASGIVYAVFSVVGLFLIAFEETDADPDAEILSYYADSGNRTGDIIGFVMVTVGVLFFLLFVSTLRDRLRSGERGSAMLSTLAFGAGVVSAGLLICGGAALAATSFAADFIDAYEVDPNLARFAFALGYAFFVGSVVVTSGLLIATSVLAIRTSVLPPWLGWVGFAAVVLALIEAFLLPVFVVPAWTVVVSVVLVADSGTGHPR